MTTPSRGSRVNDAQRRQIERYWNDNNLEDRLARSVPRDVRQELFREAIDQMAVEGKYLHADPGVRNLYGTEAAARAKAMSLGWINQKLLEHRDLIHHAACVEFEYCEKRRRGDLEKEGYTLSLAVADALLTFATGFPLPVTLISVYLVKNHILDDWCDCPERVS